MWGVPSPRSEKLQVKVKTADLHQGQVIFRAPVAKVTGDIQHTAWIPPEGRTVELGGVTQLSVELHL